MFVLALVITVIELSEGRIRIFVALGIVLFPILMIGFGSLLFRKEHALLTLSPEGIRFCVPSFGPVAWNSIGSVAVAKIGLFGLRVLAIEIKPKVPPSTLLFVNLVGIGKKKIDGREHVFYALRNLDRSQAEIEEAVVRARGASESMSAHIMTQRRS
jgi:hypothetical protein